MEMYPYEGDPSEQEIYKILAMLTYFGHVFGTVWTQFCHGFVTDFGKSA